MRDSGYLKKFPGGGNSPGVGLTGSNMFFGMLLQGGFNLTNITGYAGVRYTHDNIMAYIDMVYLGTDYPSQVWMTSLAIDIGNAQLERLDRYLGR